MTGETQPQERRRIERRAETHLSDDQIEAIAEKAATRAMQKMSDEMFKAVGKNVVQKLFWLIGMASVGVYLWLQSRGYIK